MDYPLWPEGFYMYYGAVPIHPKSFRCRSPGGDYMYVATDCVCARGYAV